jgi:hypothetical protein
MRLLPWRKLEKNPWDDPFLTGWTPGIAVDLDLLALIASVSRSQYDLGLQIVRLTRLYAVLSLLWVFVVAEVMAMRWGLW